MNVQEAWKELVRRKLEIDSLDRIGGLLGWDQQTGMPPQGAPERARQVALISSIRHQRQVDPRVGELISRVESAGDLDEVQRAGVRNLRRDWDRAVKLPVDLVERAARAQAEAFTAWLSARDADDFDGFVPALSLVFALSREAAQAIRTDEACDYDVLLSEFAPGTATAQLTPMFDRLTAELETFLRAVQDLPAPDPIRGVFPLDAQRAFSREMIRALGYDLSRGRMDEAQHPFTIGFGPGDVRITTHLYPEDLLAGMGGTIHEVGHALYEQGLPAEWAGTGVGSAAGFGVHESQSRFWENFIGRSMPFFRWLSPALERHLPGFGLTPEALYGAANTVRRGAIRISADEATYNLHIVVRYRLEQALFSGDLAVADLRDAWDQAYDDLLGLRPPNARDGVLQDIHWSSGAIGYFPSYTIGNLYAASLGATLQSEMPDLWERVERGEFAPVLAWMREKIHRKGHLLDGPDLIRGVVGERDPVEDLIAHLWARHGQLYGVNRPR